MNLDPTRCCRSENCHLRSLAVAVALVCGFLTTPSLLAQTAPANSPGDISSLAATWQGTLHAGQDIRFLFHGLLGFQQEVWQHVHLENNRMAVSRGTFDNET